MFNSKRSWYWYAFWALVFAGFVFCVARFFLKAVEKDSHDRLRRYQQKKMRKQGELFI